MKLLCIVICYLVALLRASSSAQLKATRSSIMTTHLPCPAVVDGHTTLSINFVRYMNPSDLKATSVPCDNDGSSCDLVFEICISEIGKSDCSFLYEFTDVLGESTQINFYRKVGQLPNPIDINLGNITRQGVNILMTVWDRDDASSRVPYDEVDEFDYDFTDAAGSDPRLLSIDGIRPTSKSRLVAFVTVRCPESAASSTKATSAWTVPYTSTTVKPTRIVTTPATSGHTATTSTPTTTTITTTQTTSTMPYTNTVRPIPITNTATRSITLTSSSTTSPPTTTPRKTITTTAQLFRCSCPISILDERTGAIQPDAPVVRLQKGSHLLFNLRSRSQGAQCNQYDVINECKTRCRTQVSRFYANYGPTRNIQVDGRYILLGEYVCGSMTQDFVSGVLAAHSQVVDCDRAGITGPVSRLDEKFYCHKGKFCSGNFHQRSTIFGGHYENCYALKASLDPNSKPEVVVGGLRCSCQIGTSSGLGMVELAMTMPAIYFSNKSCDKAVQECMNYCNTKGGERSIDTLGGIASVVENDAYGTPISHHINDLVCETLKPNRMTMLKTAFYSQVDGCPAKETTTSKTTTKLYNLNYNTYCF